MSKGGQYVFNKTGTIQRNIGEYSGGQTASDWEEAYPDIRLAEALFRPSERFEENQPVSTQRTRWMCWKGDKVIDPATMRLVVDNVIYNIEGTEPYLKDKRKMFIYTVTKDNESSITLPSEVSSFSVTNSSQSVGSGSAITAMVGTADNPSVFGIDGTYTGLTLTTDSETQCTITGTPSGTLSFTVWARGKGGGVKVDAVSITVTVAGGTWEADEASGVTLQNWYDASTDEADYLTLVDGLVSQWDDRTGSHDVSEATAGQRPASMSSHLNSKRGTLFRGVDSLQSSGAVTSSEAFWVFAVLKPPVAVANQYVFKSEGAVNNIYWAFDKNNRFFIYQGSGIAYYTYPTSDYTTYWETQHLFGIYFNKTSSEIWIDGVQEATPSLGSGDGEMGGNFYLGSFAAGGNLGLGSYMYEFIILDETTGLTTADREKMEGWLMWKWHTVTVT